MSVDTLQYVLHLPHVDVVPCEDAAISIPKVWIRVGSYLHIVDWYASRVFEVQFAVCHLIFPCLASLCALVQNIL